MYRESNDQTSKNMLLCKKGNTRKIIKDRTKKKIRLQIQTKLMKKNSTLYRESFYCYLPESVISLLGESSSTSPLSSFSVSFSPLKQTLFISAVSVRLCFRSSAVSVFISSTRSSAFFASSFCSSIATSAME